jgi:iron complex transport system substrate-binding protein
MKKWGLPLVLMIFIMLVLAGCGGGETEDENTQEDATQPSEQANEFPITITDATGDEVTIEAKPERIISIIPSNTEIAFELGLGDEMVGVSNFDNYPEEALEKEKIGDMELNIEKIISLDPDLVLSHASRAESGAQAFEQLKSAGITVLTINDAQNLDEVYESFAMIGKATGKTKEADELVNDMKANIEEIQTKAAEISDKRSVFVEVSPAPEIFTTGNNTFMNEMLGIINAENIVSDLEGWVKLDQEAIIERNPDVIVTTYGYYIEDPVSGIKNRAGWQDIQAVKNNRIVDVDSDAVTRTGPRLDEGLAELAKAVYPEAFSE